ncbi:hypothetical protein Echvi_3701 [Echinicola vietnamensis DSM 17526]|uniref:Uncharacterized protein n=1 Tax=Echinicola vietnamensis (strain DSM 17526 / LMG 23754 / KMM 6221) TaxID=926556 RepID=L0G3M1_ECHVK|nr:hypothetical protein Echvi_3701 [Echinicola vietnamensis DSM 17526]
MKGPVSAFAMEYKGGKPPSPDASISYVTLMKGSLPKRVIGIIAENQIS